MAGLSVFVNFYLSKGFSTLFAEDSDRIHLLSHAIWTVKALLHPSCETLNMIPMRTMRSGVVGLGQANGTLLFLIILKFIGRVIKDEIDISTVNLRI